MSVDPDLAKAWELLDRTARAMLVSNAMAAAGVQPIEAGKAPTTKAEPPDPALASLSEDSTEASTNAFGTESFGTAWEPGNLVVLRSGGPVMVVEYVNDDTIETAWNDADGTGSHDCSFKRTSLIRVGWGKP